MTIAKKGGYSGGKPASKVGPPANLPSALVSTPCHPRCALGPDRDHPGYLEYRCIDEDVNALPFPGEEFPQ